MKCVKIKNCHIKGVAGKALRSGGHVIGCYLFFTLVIGIAAGFSFAYILLTVDLPDTFSLQIFRSMKVLDNPNQGTYTTIGQELAQKVKVLCWVMTQPQNHETKARHVKATWGKRCTKLLFISSAEDKNLPALKPQGVREGKIYLWGKTRAAFRYIYEHHRNEADWFLKADDDTYVIVDNLRYMLSDYDSRDPIYFGCRFNRITPQGYMSGGAGYVLSREALDRFANKAMSDSKLCRPVNFGNEDVEMGKCLYNVGVRAVDSRDYQKRDRFLPFRPEVHLMPENNLNSSFWFWRYIFYPKTAKSSCCSDYAITFHDISPQMMYAFEYFLYHLRPYGFHHHGDRPPLISKRHQEIDNSKIDYNTTHEEINSI